MPRLRSSCPVASCRCLHGPQRGVRLATYPSWARDPAMPSFSTRTTRFVLVAFTLALAACSSSQPPVAGPSPDAAAAAAAARDQAAAKDLAMYEQLRTLGNLELAAPIGRQVLAKYPGTAAAAQVQKTLTEVESAAKDGRVAGTFDDAAPQNLRASLPPTGEPAMFIEDDAIFLAKMAKARTVAIQATPKGKPAYTLKFDVGGFDASKWPEVAKSG